MVEGKNQWKAWLYLLPCLILLLIFTVYPIINTVGIAFLEDYNAMASTAEVTYEIGFGNFEAAVNNIQFMPALMNTLILCVVTVPVSTLLALLIAVCLNSIKPLNRLLQTIYFLPYVTNTIAIGMVFAAMFNIVGSFFGTDKELITTAGIINNIIGVFGIEPINWINSGSEHWANMTVMIIYIVWNALPFKILILLGGLQSVNKQYYDAAKIDGTSRSRTFWRITVPLLSPMIAYVVITGFIGGFKEYSSVVGIFGKTMQASGNTPENTMKTVVGLVYDALEGSNYGSASATALILFGIIFAVTLVQLYVQKKKVHY